MAADTGGFSINAREVPGEKHLALFLKAGLEGLIDLTVSHWDADTQRDVRIPFENLSAYYNVLHTEPSIEDRDRDAEDALPGCVWFSKPSVSWAKPHYHQPERGIYLFPPTKTNPRWIASMGINHREMVYSQAAAEALAVLENSSREVVAMHIKAFPQIGRS